VKLLVKLVIAGLLANAAYRVGTEYLAYIRFREAVREIATFRSTTNEDLRQRIAGLAARYDIPQSDDHLDIVREDRHVVVTGEYEKPIEVVPTYEYPWHFDWSLDVTMPVSLPYYPPGK
jgi:hypothetical protein